MVALAAVAALIRLPPLLHDGLWRDGAYVYVDLCAPTVHEFFRRLIETEWHPPLYFAIAYVWTALFGKTELSFTLLPFLISIATVPVVYGLGRMVAGPSSGIVSAAIFAISPLAVTYSTEYLYPLAAALFALLACATLWTIQKGPSLLRLSGLAILTGAVLYTHYVALFYVTALMLLVLAVRSCKRTTVLIASALAAGALTFVAWLPIFFHQQQIGVPWRLETAPSQKAAFAISVLLESTPARPYYPECVFAIVIVTGLVILGRSRALSPSAVGLGALFLAGLSCVTAANLLEIRYVFPFYGLLCVFLGWVLCATADHLKADNPIVWRRFGRALCVIFPAIFLIGDVQDVTRSTSMPKSGIRSFVSAEPPNSNTLYVVAPDYTAATLSFYARKTPIRILGFARVEQPEIFRLAGYALVWNDPAAVGRALLAIAQTRRRFASLDVVVDENARNGGRMPYGKTHEFLRAVEARYGVLGVTTYVGRYESIAVYHFALK